MTPIIWIHTACSHAKRTNPNLETSRSSNSSACITRQCTYLCRPRFSFYRCARQVKINNSHSQNTWYLILTWIFIIHPLLTGFQLLDARGHCGRHEHGPQRSVRGNAQPALARGLAVLNPLTTLQPNLDTLTTLQHNFNPLSTLRPNLDPPHSRLYIVWSKNYQWVNHSWLRVNFFHY